MRLSQHQAWIKTAALEFPVVAALGGRGAGRTTAFWCAAAEYLSEHDRARALYVRQTIPSLMAPWEDVQATWQALGVPFTTNKNELTLTLNNRSSLQLGPLEDGDTAYFDKRYRGASLQFLGIDEASTWSVDPQLPYKLFGSLRHGSYDTHAAIMSNPGPSGPLLYKHLLEPARRHPSRVPNISLPFQCPWLGSKTVLVAFGTYRDNPNLPPDYLQNLRAASASEAAFLRDVEGSFQSTDAALFLLHPHHFVRWPQFDPLDYPHLHVFIGYDHGTVAPWCGVWLARFRDSGIGPDGQHYPANSYVAFAESHSADPDNYTKATGTFSVAEIAEVLKDHAESLGFLRVPTVYADDAVVADVGKGSVLDEFKSRGIRMQPCGKEGRQRGNIHRINELLRGATPPLGQVIESTTIPGFRVVQHRTEPGLYLTANVPYLRAALEQAFSDPHFVDSFSSKFRLKHATDALSYGLTARSKNYNATSTHLAGLSS